MSIRRKLLILLLATALLPLTLSAILYHVAMHRLGDHLASRSRETFTALLSDTERDLMGLASHTREVLAEDARRELQLIVDDYTRILERDKTLVGLMLRMQACRVEHALAAEPPPSPKVIFAGDLDRIVRRYDETGELSGGMILTETHRRVGPDGKLVPMPITYENQVCFVPAGVNASSVPDDMARLSIMRESYRLLHEIGNGLLHWQYTALESGLHTSYPGHGGYPPEYDPRKRRWYQDVKKEGGMVWGAPIVDATTGTILLPICMPVRRPDGSFAGVTSVDVPLHSVFRELKLPEHLADKAKMAYVWADESGVKYDGKPLIIARQSYEDIRQHWQEPVALDHLEADDAQALAALVKDALAGNCGVRDMSRRGKPCLWAHGAADATGLFPVLIVPYDLVVARAAEAEQAVLRRTAAARQNALDKTSETEQHILTATVRSLRTTGVILLAVVVLAAVGAFARARSMTRPVRRLARAGKTLADGDYDVRVDIRTGDELQKLGEAFNSMVPRLEEHQRMKQALALATEIQQNLLPQEPPALDGFEIAGRSVYCEETGGDYFDFIDLVELGPGRLGIALGDVSGHGISAALLMVTVRGVLRSHAALHGSDLGHLLGVLNRSIIGNTDQVQFVTLFYGVLEAGDRSLRWTSGGHDPAIWVRGGGRIEELENTGMVLGVVPSAAYEASGPITLAAGDLIVVGTDGIWETRSPGGEMFGKERLRQILAAHAHAPAQEIYTAVVDAVSSFRDAGAQEDDVTLVVIKAL